VIKNDKEKFTEVPNLPKALTFTLAMYREELEVLLPKYPLITICNKLSLPEVRFKLPTTALHVANDFFR
jgi:hypothetical protein